VAAARHIGKGARRAMEPAPFFKPKCFVAGTEVLMHDGSSRPIEEIEPGDRVASRSDEGTQDSPVVEGRVTRVFRSVAQGSLLIRFDGGGTVETTDEHPFYVPGRGFVEAEDLRTGDRVAEDDGGLSVVAAVSRLTEPKEVYNLEVEGTHTYFVRAGDDWLWVHNQCRMPDAWGLPSTGSQRPLPNYEWRGRPGSRPGDSNGSWYNPKDGTVLYPDLNHPQPIGPHWDYKDTDGQWWRLFPNGDLGIKKQ
jgi:hypothetical protein